MGEQDVADQRGAFACRGPRHPRGGGALLRMAGRGDPFSLSSMPLPAGGSFPAVPPCGRRDPATPRSAGRATPGHDQGVPPSDLMAGRLYLYVARLRAYRSSTDSQEPSA